MFYKVIFEKPVEYDRLSIIEDNDGNIVDYQINRYTGLDSLIYSNSQIDLLLNDKGEIKGLQICNECTKTFNIESHLLQLAYKLVMNQNISVEVFEGNGFSEIMDGASLEEYLES
ncbi:MAG TPA: hypothetical protein ENN33_14845 [Ignavibacteria bacterium]|nr:hypothetical protein [Ignavibacteria bacterium]